MERIYIPLRDWESGDETRRTKGLFLIFSRVMVDALVLSTGRHSKGKGFPLSQREIVTTAESSVKVNQLATLLCPRLKLNSTPFFSKEIFVSK